MSKNKRVAIFVLAILLLPFCASAQEFLNLKKLSDRATKAELPLNTAEIVFVAQTNDLVITSSSPTYDRFSPPYRNKEGQYEYVGTIDINDGYPYRHFLVEKKGTGFTARTKEKLAFAQGDRLYMEVSEPEVKFILSPLTTRAWHLVENECCVQISSPLPDLIVTAPEELGCKIESKHTNSGSFLTTIKVSTIVLDQLRAQYSGQDGAEELEKRTTLQISFANSNEASVSVRDLVQRDKLQYNVLPFTSSAPVEEPATSAASQYVVFKVTPSEALVSLNGERLFVKDGVASKYVPQGRYEYTVECALYHSKSGTVTVGEKKETVEVTLVPAFGYISISGRTSNGATVYIDNQQVGSVPLSQYCLSSGTHTIEVVKDLYKPYRAEVQVAEGKTNQMELELEANFAQVELVAENGVSIYINGIYAGEGKVSEKLSYGSYEVETRKENHRSVKDVYEISSSSMNKTYKLALPEPIYGSVRVESVPAEAEVWVDGEKKDVTPCVLSLMIGHHEIMLQKQGFAKATRAVTVKEGEMAEVTAELAAGRQVVLKSDPTGAALYVDGSYAGTAPVSTKLAFGTHTVKAVNDGVEKEETITVSENGQSEWTLNVQNCGQQIKDYDGNTYATVQIGDQCWMKENLRTTHYADGTSISHGSTTSYIVGYWYYPNDNSSNKATYGLLYNWAAVMRNSSSSNSNPSGVQGICPKGWHVPSDNEWKQMEMAVGMSQRDADDFGFRGNIAAKLCGNTDWNSSSTANAAGNLNAPDRNSTGFSALPAGYYRGYYDYFGGSAYFWSATETSSDGAYYRGLSYNDAGVFRNYFNKANGYSVRCVRD